MQLKRFTTIPKKGFCENYEKSVENCLIFKLTVFYSLEFVRLILSY